MQISMQFIDALANSLLKLFPIFKILFIIIIILLLLYLVLILIYLIVNIVIFLINIPWKRFGEKFREIKSKFIEYFGKFQNLRFHNYIDITNVFLIIIVILYKVDLYYLLCYLPLYIITRTFIAIVRDLIRRSKDEEGITEFWFFVYIGIFILLIVAYIFSFSLFYLNLFSLNQGYMINEKGTEIDLSGSESIYYSAFTFFGMEYENLKPQEIFRTFTVIEVFIAQLWLVTFIGVMVSKLIGKLMLKGLEEGKNE
ncbi:hypothetical protein KY361_06600 [Candidatus Woesearchaeota archaeon]|nr:hypothetical protein [Candidatus Woesearchaeota archaeon]